MTDPSETLPETWEEAAEQKAAEAEAQAKETSEPVDGGTTAGSPAEAPGDTDGAETGPDLSFLDRKVRPTMEALLRGESVSQEDMDALIKEQKDGYKRQDLFHKKRQIDAQKRKDAEAAAEEAGRDAQRWRALMRDEGMQKHILTYDPQQMQEEEVPEDLFIGRDPKEVLKMLDDRYEKRLAAEKERWQRELLTTIEEPVKQATALDEAANAWAAENDVPDEVLVEACRSMSETIGRDKLDPDIVVRLLPKFAEDVVATARREQQAKDQRAQADTDQRARAASPRGGVGVATPTHATAEQRIAEKEEELGRALTPLEQANLYFDDHVMQSGKSERELDEEWNAAKRHGR